MGCKRPEEGLEITASELPLRVCGRRPVSAVKDKSGPFRRQTGWNRGEKSFVPIRDEVLFFPEIGEWGFLFSGEMAFILLQEINKRQEVFLW